MIDTALIDIDGTLIDNNLLHVLAWQRAFRRLGHEIDSNTIVHLIGMGSDKLPAEILGESASDDLKHASDLHSEEYSQNGLIDHAQPLPGANELLSALKDREVRVVLASSAKQEEVDHYLKLLDNTDTIDEIVTSRDVSNTKPEGDIFASALKKVDNPVNALVIGDTVFDIEAAGKLGIPCAGVLTGGIERKLLLDAGAARVYLSVADIVTRLDEILAIEAASSGGTVER